MCGIAAILDARDAGPRTVAMTTRLAHRGPDDHGTWSARLRDADRDEVVALLGEVASSRSLAAAPEAQRAKVPMISPASTNPKLTQQNFKATFRTIANDVQQGLAIGKYAATKLGTKIALIDDRTAYGQGVADEFEKGVKGAGGSGLGDFSGSCDRFDQVGFVH